MSLAAELRALAEGLDWGDGRLDGVAAELVRLVAGVAELEVAFAEAVGPDDAEGDEGGGWSYVVAGPASVARLNRAIRRADREDD